MRQVENDGEHIWLRQSVTFTTARWQTRTVEIAIPLRPDATEEEIEALLHQADAGMAQLTHHLDARVAALVNAEVSALPSLPPPDDTITPSAPDAAISAPGVPGMSPSAALASSAPHTHDTDNGANAPRTTPPARDRDDAGAKPISPAVARGEETTSSVAEEEPAVPARAASALPSTNTRPPTRTTTPPRQQPAAPAPAPARTRPATPQPASSDEPLTLPVFISQAQAEFGLNPKQAMDRLGVRSLSGLNLREALEALRRQELRAGDMSSDAAPSAPIPTPAADAHRAAPATAPQRFDEEDDEQDIAFAIDGDDGSLNEEFAPYDTGQGASGAAERDALDDYPDDLDDEDEEDLDDVPNFGPPPSARQPASAPRRAAAAPRHPNSSANTSRTATESEGQNVGASGGRPARRSATPSEETDEAASASLSEERTRALQILGQMRSVHSGGAPTSQQRTAYRNIVARELGEQEATALVRAIWKITPERLGSDQMDELIGWGKRDTFAEEAMLVLAVLREQAQPSDTHSAPDEESAPPSARTPASGTRPRSANPGSTRPTNARGGQ